MTLEINYIILQNGIPKRLQFSELHFEDRDLVDPISGLPKIVRTLVGTVTREDGQEAAKTLSITATKLQTKLLQYMPDPLLPGRIFVITKNGAGFQTEYSLEVI